MSLRLDAALVQRGICETRNRAQTSIAEGHVTVNGIVCMKASQKVSENDALVLTEPLPFVGRGGYKLSFALAEFKLSLSGLHCLDIGASTGGFTDCMLQNGAASVLAVDVGHDQLAEALRSAGAFTGFRGTAGRICSLRCLVYFTQTDHSAASVAPDRFCTGGAAGQATV